MSTGTGLRTALFTPADRPDRVTKALQLPTDAVIVDLEDAVHDSAKAEARARIRAYAALDRRPGLALLVRVNALGTPFAETDLAAIALPGVDGVVLPMVSTCDDLVETDQVLTRAERAAGLREGAIPVIAIIETAAGVTGLSGLAQRPLRLSQLAFGAGDLALDLGVSWTSDNPALLNAKAQLPLWSRALGLPGPLDTAYPRVRDHEGFEQECTHAAALGFGGKMCIHPDQLDIARRVFLPGVAEIERAHRVVVAFDAASRDGRAAITVDGDFVDYPVAARARQLLDTLPDPSDQAGELR